MSCSGHAPEVLSPKHIETPAYPVLPRVARIMGKVKLALTIDADGNVKSAEATTDNSGHKLLVESAIQNVKKMDIFEAFACSFHGNYCL
jgi:TonB family protein